MAIATFKDSTPSPKGILTRSSARETRESDKPEPSLPNKINVGVNASNFEEHRVK